MLNGAVRQIRQLCPPGSDFSAEAYKESNFVTVIFPYDNAEFDIEVCGNTVNEQVQSFIVQVNSHLDDMINHLEECKLSE
jgi:hypothetical protein